MASFVQLAVCMAALLCANNVHAEGGKCDNGLKLHAVAVALNNSELGTLALSAMPMHAFTFGGRILSKVPEAMMPLVQQPQIVAIDKTKVMVLGGVQYKTKEQDATDSSLTKAVLEFDTEKSEWKKLADLPSGVHQFGVVNTGKYIVAVGGDSSAPSNASQPVDKILVYSIAGDKWEVSDLKLAKARTAPDLVLMDDKIYVFGGVVKFDESTPQKTARVCNESEVIALGGDGRPTAVSMLPSSAKDTEPGSAGFFDYGSWTDCNDMEMGESHYLGMPSSGLILRCVMSTCRLYSVAKNEWTSLMCTKEGTMPGHLMLPMMCSASSLITEEARNGQYTGAFLDAYGGQTTYVPINADGTCSQYRAGSMGYLLPSIMGRSAMYSESTDENGNPRYTQYMCHHGYYVSSKHVYTYMDL